MALKGKTAVVTGSTSGIGHGIAHALAKDGANIVVNGLGTEKDNEKAIARGQGARHARGVRSRQHAAPQPDRRHDRQGRARLRLGRHPRQQCRHPARGAGGGVPDRAMGLHHRHQPDLGLPHDARGGARHEEAQVGRIINICSAHSLRASPFKCAYVSAKHGLAGFTKTVALELAEHGVTCQRHLAGLRVDAAGGEADPRPRQVGEHLARSRPSARCCRASPPTGSSRWNRSRPWPRSWRANRSLHHRRQLLHRRRLDGAIAICSRRQQEAPRQARVARNCRVRASGGRLLGLPRAAEPRWRRAAPLPPGDIDDQGNGKRARRPARKGRGWQRRLGCAGHRSLLWHQRHQRA